MFPWEDLESLEGIVPVIAFSLSTISRMPEELISSILEMRAGTWRVCLPLITCTVTVVPVYCSSSHKTV